jgi:hypothetical protein
MEIQNSAVTVHEGDFGIGHLSVPTVPAELDDRFAQRRHALKIISAQLAASCVCRDRPTRCDVSLPNEGSAGSLLAETKILEQHDGCIGKAVVQLAHVDVV